MRDAFDSKLVRDAKCIRERLQARGMRPALAEPCLVNRCSLFDSLNLEAGEVAFRAWTDPQSNAT